MLRRLRNYLTGASAVEAATMKELRSIEDRFLKRVASLEQRLAAAEQSLSLMGPRVARIVGRTSTLTRSSAELSAVQGVPEAVIETRSPSDL